MFEKAAKLKLRFTTQKGLLTTEDLFDLSLPSLDRVAKEVNRILKESDEESFISTTRKDTTNALRLEILKYVIKEKMEAKEAAKVKGVKAAQKAELEELLTAKKREGLSNLSEEEIQKKLDELG